MTAPLEDDEAAIIVELEKLGEVEVRRCLNSKLFSMAYDEPARRWIEAIDRASVEESERRKDASIAEQINIARSAKNAAWTAAIAAIIAATIAIIGAFISYLAWSRPHPSIYLQHRMWTDHILAPCFSGRPRFFGRLTFAPALSFVVGARCCGPAFAICLMNRSNLGHASGTNSILSISGSGFFVFMPTI